MHAAVSRCCCTLLLYAAPTFLALSRSVCALVAGCHTKATDACLFLYDIIRVSLPVSLPTCPPLLFNACLLIQHHQSLAAPPSCRLRLSQGSLSVTECHRHQ